MINPASNLYRLGKRFLPRLMFSCASAGIGFGLAGGCASQQDNENNRSIPEVPFPGFAVKWNAEPKLESGDEATEIHLRENFVIIYTRQHWAYVLDKDQGGIRFWAHITNEHNALHPPVVMKEWIVFPTINTLEVYSRQGKKLRSVDTGGISLRSNAVGEGTRVFFGGDGVGGGRLVCEDLSGSAYKDASIRWELLTRGGVGAAPVVHQGLAYVGDERGGVYAVNADSREPVWPIVEEGVEENVFRTRGPIKADLKGDDYGLFVTSTDTKLYCLERTSGKIRWQYFAETALDEAPYVTPTTVYLPVPGKGLIAIEKTSGEFNRRPKWIMEDGLALCAEDEKHAYIVRHDHSLAAVDKTNGQKLFTSKRNDFVAFTANTMKDPKVSSLMYGVTRDGNVQSIIAVYRPGTHGDVVLLQSHDQKPRS